MAALPNVETLPIPEIPPPALAKKVEMLWPEDGVWYGAVVIDYNPHSRNHCVLYDEGTNEWVDFATTDEEKRITWREAKNQVGGYERYWASLRSLKQEELAEAAQREQALLEQQWAEQQAAEQQALQYADGPLVEKVLGTREETVEVDVEVAWHDAQVSM